MTGSGKTNVELCILTEIPVVDPCASVIAFDRHDNFSGLQELPGHDWLLIDAKTLRFALYELVTPGFVRMVNLLLGEVRGLIKSLNLVFESYTQIARALARLAGPGYAPSLGHIVETLKSGSFKFSKDDYLRSCLTELADMQNSTGAVWGCSRSDMMTRLTAPGMHTVIRTGALDSKEELFLVTWMLTYCIEAGNARPYGHAIYFVIDEGQPVFARDTSDFNALRTLKQGVLTARQPMLFLVIGLQMPSRAQPELLASAATIICTGLQDTNNIREVAGAMGISPDHAHDLFQSLALNEAVYNCAGRPGPFKIEVPLAPVQKGCDEIKRREKVRKFLESCHVEHAPAWDELHREIVKISTSRTITLNDADTRLLRECAITYERPLPLKDLAAKVGTGASEATYSGRRLEQLGYAERQEAAIARNRLVFIEPVQNGWDFLGLRKPSGVGDGKAPHRYCVTWRENLLVKRSFKTFRNVERGGKRIDLIGEKPGSVVFVEVEMTAQNAARNAVADLAVAGPEVKEIAVICPTASVLRQVRKAVESAVDAASLKRFSFKVVSDL
jgi:DNA-binding Lrp family transcriptional regulator